MQMVNDLPLVLKTEHSPRGSISSIESSPEPKADKQTSATAENVQVQKRKGGRKPVCLNSVQELRSSVGLLWV
jgi:hypothetical protein